MKTTILAILFTLSAAFAEEDPLPIEKKLQQALFAEEGTRDLDKAIEAYHAVIADYDEQRKFAATAIFRLAECHRKKEQNEKAIAAYQRLLKEFPNEETLTRLARENLAALGATAPEVGNIALPSSAPAEIARIKQLVALSPDLINDPQTGLLHKAAAESQLEVAKFLIKSGADINLVSGGNTPLEPAAGGGHLAMTELLLAKGAKLTARAFDWAVMNQRSAVIDRLLEALQEDEQELLAQAVRAAASSGRADYLKRLIAKGAPPAHLGVAIASGNLESVQVLLDAGATTDDAAVVLAARGSTPDPKINEQIFDLVWEHSNKPAMAIRVAIEEARDPGRALQIINSVEDIEAEGGLGTTPLGYVAYMNDPKLVRATLARGADPNAKDSKGTPPLIWAVFADFQGKERGAFDADLTEIIDLLLNAGAEIDATDTAGNSAITIAAWGRSVGGGSQMLADIVVERLLAAKPDPLQLNPQGESLTKANNSRIRLYTILRMPNRGEKVWLIDSRANPPRPASSAPARLSQILLEENTFDPSIVMYAPGKLEPMTIDYAQIIAAGDPSKDPIFEPGSIVELVGEETVDADPKIYDFLQKAAAKSVTISHGEHQWKGEARIGTRPNHPYDPSQRVAYASTVMGLLSAISAPTAKSDLTRIEVKHADGEISTVNVLVANLDLREGDHITLSPISSAASKDAIWLSRESDLFLFPLAYRRDPTALFPKINLYELLAAAYSSSQFVLPSPDLSKITRRSGDEVFEVSLEGREGGPAFLVEGSVINIPSLAEPEVEWTNLDEGVTLNLAQRLARTAKFEIKGGATREAKVGPQFYRFPVGANGLRSIEPLATPSDKEFEVLGLSAATAIRNLGYLPTDRLDVLYHVNRSGTDIVPVNYLTVPAREDPLLPIISPDALVSIQMRGVSNSKAGVKATSRRPPTRARTPQKSRGASSPAPAPGKALIDAINKANAAKSAPRPGSNNRTRGRRVVLPPKSR